MPIPPMNHLLAGGQVTQNLARVPTQAERDELAKLQGWQLRTNAATIAGTMLEGQAPTAQAFCALAAVVEDYIRGQ